MKNRMKHLLVTTIILLLSACGGTPTDSIGGENDSSANYEKPIISILDFDGGNAYGIELSSDGKTAFIANGYHGLEIVDISNPKRPSLIKSFQLPNENGIGYDKTYNIYDISLSKNNKIAYLVDKLYGLQIVDVSNLNHPQVIAKLKTQGASRKIKVSNNGEVVYVADADYDETKSGLRIISVKNPKNPILLGEFQAMDSIKGIQISKDNKVAYLADNYDGLKIVDISNLKQPELISSIEISDESLTAVGLSPNGKIAYVSDKDDELVFVDISDSKAPFVLNRVATTRSTVDNIATSKDGNRVYLSAYRGPQFINTSNKESSFRIGEVVTKYYTRDIRLSKDGTKAYLANGLSGLIIMDITDF